MALNIETLKALRGEKLLSTNQLRFRVVVDGAGGYHLVEHRRPVGSPKTPPLPRVSRSGKQVFEHLAPCCLKKKNWRDNNNFNVTAEQVVKTRNGMLEILENYQAQRPSDALEAVNLIGDLRITIQKEHRGIFSYCGEHYTLMQEIPSPWKTQFGKMRDKELIRLEKSLHHLDQSKLLERFALEVIGTPSQSLVANKKISNGIIKAYQDAIFELANAEQEFLIRHGDVYLPLDLAAVELFSIGRPGLLRVPSSVFEYFHAKSLVYDWVRCQEDDDEHVIEALKVLYDHYNRDAAYSKLNTALKAARVL